MPAPLARCTSRVPWRTATLFAGRAPARPARASSLCLERLSNATRPLSTSPPPPPQPKLGQPIYETHPHILKPGELTPGCTALEYAVRRAKLAAELPLGGIAILPAATLKYRSGPVFYEFHQNADLYYLTGFLEPEAVCVIEKTGQAGEGQHCFHMFVRPKDDFAEMWDGARTGVQAVMDVFNADEAYDIAEARHRLPAMIEKATNVYYDEPGAAPESSSFSFSSFFSSPPQQQGNTLTAVLSQANKRARPLLPTMHRLRAIKSASEIAVMREAGRISGRVYNEAMGQRIMSESDLAAFLDSGFRIGGCETSAYVPVVAGGHNALSIHYTKNNALLFDDDLVLVDAGGQYGGYVTDITRTWPVNGKFSPPQRDLYEAVLTVQRKCVALCKETAGVTLDDIHRVSTQLLTKELEKLGFDMSKNALDSVLYPHHVGHYIGIDLHDCGTYGRATRLRAGQIVTVEPGVYVPDDKRWPKHFRGMGIRIEDSVCVGEESPIILSVEAVKEIVDIEALRDSWREAEALAS